MMKKVRLIFWLFCFGALGAFAAADSSEIMIEMPDDLESASVDSMPPIEKMPEISRFVNAQYPLDLMKKGVQGVVLLELLVNDSGLVDSVKVVNRLHPVLDLAACDAAKQFRFTPATAGGKPVAVLLQYEYRFAIEQSIKNVEKFVNFEGVLVESGTRKPVSDAMVVISFPDTTADSLLPMPFSMYLKKIGSIEGQSIEEQKIVALTDSAGRFRFNSLPACSVNVDIIVPGYEALRTKEFVSRKEVTNAKYFIQRYSYSEYEIVVYGKAEEKEVSKHQLTIQEIKLIPGLGGDAVKVVQAMPGVARPSFGSGEVVVRGAPTWDSKFYLDGIEIPVLYHFGGLKSTYNSDALKSVDFMPGGWGTRYGGAVAGVIELNSRGPKTDRWHGYLDMSTIDGSFLVEGPITDKVSVMLSARRSFIGDIIHWASKKYSDVFPMTIATFYWDYVFRTDVNFSKNNHLFLTLFGSSDSLDIVMPDMRYGSSEISEKTNSFGMNQTFHLGLLGWDYTFNDHWSNTARYSLTGGRADVSPFGFMKSETDFIAHQIRDQVSWKKNDKFKINGGGDVQLTTYDIDMKIPDATGVIQESKDEDWLFGVVGVYLNCEWKPLKNLTVIPGIRYDYYPELDYEGSVIPEFWDYQAYKDLKGISGEPSVRLNTRYVLTKKHTVKASVGNYSQTPKPVGQVIHKVWGDPKMPSTKAAHYVLGHEWQITDLISSDVQFYYNRQWDIPEYSTNIDASGSGSSMDLWNHNGEGRMYGLEIMLRQMKSEHFFGWVAYTLSRTERYNRADRKWEVYDQDETHHLQVLGSWHLKKEWDLGFRLRTVTGKPLTPVIGREYNEQYSYFYPLYGEKNSDRNDPFFQLDIRADKKFVFDKWMYSIYFDLQNISYFFYKSPEFEYYDDFYKEKKIVSSFPMLGIGCKAEF